MKKVFFFVIITALSVNISTAQKSELMKLGLKAGINYANYTSSDINTDAITNFHAGLVLEIKVLKNFSFQPELLYSTQGAEVDALGEQIKNELGYISIPVLAKFNLNDNLSMELGPQVSFLLNERNNFSLKDSNTFDFAVAGGLSYKLGKHLFISGRYGLGLTEPKRDASVKNSVLQASFGFML